jgi:hypothetical protein
MNGIDMLLVAGGLLFLLVTVSYWEWVRRDQARRLERLRRRNLA